MAGILLKVINVFHGGHPVFSTPTSINSIQKSTKKRNWNSEIKQDGTQDGKQQKIQVSNSSEDRETDLINKEVSRKTKEKVLNTRIWLEHNTKVIWYCYWGTSTASSEMKVYNS